MDDVTRDFLEVGSKPLQAMDDVAALTNEEITSECKSLVRHTKENAAKIVERMLEMQRRLPHGEFLPWLNEIGVPRRTAYRWMQAEKVKRLPAQVFEAEVQKPETCHVANIKLLVEEPNLSAIKPAMPKAESEEPKADDGRRFGGGQFRSRQSVIKELFGKSLAQMKREQKERYGLFSNTGNRLLGNIWGFFTPGDGEYYSNGAMLAVLLEMDVDCLSPADLDLAFKITEALGKLSVQSAEWQAKLKEKFAR